MSNSFRDAVRQIMEGAKEKTLDGMTPDAKHFRHDLHKVTDPGVKLMVQKDSETKDYEKMFKPDTAKAKERLADMSSDKALDKYVEYNEAVRMEEKKHMKGCTCESCMAKEEKEDEKAEAKSDKKIAEASVMLGRPGMTPTPPKAAPAGSARDRLPGGATGSAGANKMGGSQAVGRAAERSVSTAPSGGSAAGMSARIGNNPGAAVKAPSNVALGRGSERSASAAAGTPDSRNLRTAVKAPSGEGATGKALAATGVSKADRLNPAFLKAQGIKGKPGSAEANLELAKKMKSQQSAVKAAENPKSAANAPTPATAAAKPAMPTRPGQGTSGAGMVAGRAAERQVATPAPSRINTQGAGGGDRLGSKVGANKPFEPSKGGAGMSLSQAVNKSPALSGKVNPNTGKALNQSYEIEINGQNYYVSEAHAAAIAAYVEKYGMIDEKSDPAVGEFISKEMKHPEKLTAKGKNQKIKQAIAIYYSKKRHGEKP